MLSSVLSTYDIKFNVKFHFKNKGNDYLLQEYIIMNKQYNNFCLCYLLQKSRNAHQRNEKYSKKVSTATDMYLSHSKSFIISYFYKRK